MLYIPQRVIISESDKKYVRVLENSEAINKDVKTGLKGDDGFIEIIEGLSVDEEIIIRTLE